jgi:NADP-dependent 3-hydroxy acid dehydrogenase YdfG
MPNEWILKLDIKSRDSNCTESLAAALTTDCEINWNGDSFHIMINEAKAKDLRAMWNTRVRGLIAVDSLLDVIDGY